MNLRKDVGYQLKVARGSDDIFKFWLILVPFDTPRWVFKLTNNNFNNYKMTYLKWIYLLMLLMLAGL